MRQPSSQSYFIKEVLQLPLLSYDLTQKLINISPDPKVGLLVLGHFSYTNYSYNHLLFLILKIVIIYISKEKLAQFSSELLTVYSCTTTSHLF